MWTDKLKDFFLKDNLFLACGIVVAVILLVWFYGCESKVRSIDGSNQMVTRPELRAELDVFLAKAEVRFKQLDQMDQLKQTLLNSLALYAHTGTLNPLGVLSSILGVLGAGAIGDNVRKRKEITTLKNNSAVVAKTAPP